MVFNNLLQLWLSFLLLSVLAELWDEKQADQGLRHEVIKCAVFDGLAVFLSSLYPRSILSRLIGGLRHRVVYAGTFKAELDETCSKTTLLLENPWTSLIPQNNCNRCVFVLISEPTRVLWISKKDRTHENIPKQYKTVASKFMALGCFALILHTIWPESIHHLPWCGVGMVAGSYASENGYLAHCQQPKFGITPHSLCIIIPWSNTPFRSVHASPNASRTCLRKASTSRSEVSAGSSYRLHGDSFCCQSKVENKQLPF